MQLHVLHFIRTRVASILQSMGQGAGKYLDTYAAETWVTALLDITVVAVTGKSLGQWTQVGFDKLAAELNADTTLGKTAFDMTAVLGHKLVAHLVEPWLPRIEASMLGGDPYATLSAVGPPPGHDFATWASHEATKLGMDLETFIIARSQLIDRSSPHLQGTLTHKKG